MRKISRAAARHGPNCMSLIGADFQCAPSEVDASGFPASLGGRVFASSSLRGTFRSGGTASHLDFFVAGGGLAEVVDSVHLVEASGVKGHVPVQLAFRPRAVALKTLAVRQPPPPRNGESLWTPPRATQLGGRRQGGERCARRRPSRK